MNTRDISNALATLFSELVEGAPRTGGYMLNGGDEGLLRSLDRLPASSASGLTATGSSIAAHVDHVRYGLSLLNRWSADEQFDPFETADWGASWRKTTVSEADWKALRAQLCDEASRWRETLSTPREIEDVDLNGFIGSIAHLAYHLGAIRQIDRAARGPAEGSQPRS
jgi:hypothetical protein